MRPGPNTTITGSQIRGANAFLDTESKLALNLSRAAGLLSPTRNPSTVDLSGTNNLTLSGAPGETVVLNLRLIRMTGTSTLTLQGSADTTYVINVNRGFSLTDASSIVLSGGLDWSDVLFNVRGTGPSVTLANNSNFQGILLASRRTVQIRDAAILRGEVMADNLQMQGAAQIVHPPVVSP
jgi:choice-of-anchor A domain-containing protein